jgi:hypothetical protein
MTLAARWMKPHSDDHPIAIAPNGAAKPGPVLKNHLIIHYAMSHRSWPKLAFVLPLSGAIASSLI